MRKGIAVTTVMLLAFGLTEVSKAQAQKETSPAAGNPVSFRLASTSTVRDYEKLTLGADEVLYVAPRAALSGDEVTSADLVAGGGLELKLANKAGERLAGVMKKHNLDRVAVSIGNKVVASGTLKVDISGNRATLSGLSSAQAERILRGLRGESIVPAGPTMTLVPGKTVVAPGEAFGVDVFVAGVTDLRVYQVGLSAIGGTRGQLKVEKMSIEATRPDYVFGARQKIDAVDEVGGRLGAMLFDGGQDVPRSAYLGTYTVRASADAAGTFTLNVLMDRTSFLRTSKNTAIDFYPGPAATITVEAPGHLRPSEGK